LIRRGGIIYRRGADAPLRHPTLLTQIRGVKERRSLQIDLQEVLEGLRPSIYPLPLPLGKGKGDKGGWDS
jgi:hypothetical protein